MRIAYIKHRLENWALWRARRDGGGQGWATQAAFLGEYDSGRYREAWVPVDDVDAELTDQAVEALRPDRPALHDVLICIYPSDLGVRGTARALGVAESTIAARLEQADRALADWLQARADRQALAAAALQKIVSRHRDMR